MQASQENIAGTPLSLTCHNEGYWQITISDPPLNLFGPELLKGLGELLRRIQMSPQLRVIVFESAIQDFFIAHFDLVKGAVNLNRKTNSDIPSWTDIAIALHEIPVVSIAAIRGRTRGVGIEFAAACDIRFASEKAIFGQFEVGVATIPGGGSMEFLPLLVGRARALEIIIGGVDLDAATAERYGLINRLIPDENLNEFVHNFAIRISHFDPVITRLAKTMLNQRAPGPSPNHMNESRTTFIQTLVRPEFKAISEKMKIWGIQQKGDFEYNLGAYLNRIGEEAGS